MPWATAVGLSSRSSIQIWKVPTTLRRPAPSSVAPAHSISPSAGRRKRIDSSDVSAIGSMRPMAANTRYHRAASARPNCVGPEMNPPGRMHVGRRPRAGRRRSRSPISTHSLPLPGNAVAHHLVDVVGRSVGGVALGHPHGPVWHRGGRATQHRAIVVVGASLAGLRAVRDAAHRRLRRPDHARSAPRPHLPYDRPPLSKKLLAGEWEPDRIALRQPDDVDELGLDLRLGVPAAALDVDGRAVELADGTRVPFDGLVIATGSATAPAARPGRACRPSTSCARSTTPSPCARASPTARPRVVVIGAGFIGLEVAATARAEGCDGHRARGRCRRR